MLGAGCVIVSYFYLETANDTIYIEMLLMNVDAGILKGKVLYHCILLAKREKGALKAHSASKVCSFTPETQPSIDQRIQN